MKILQLLKSLFDLTLGRGPLAKKNNVFLFNIYPNFAKEERKNEQNQK